jgi:hypothetical protein
MRQLFSIILPKPLTVGIERELVAWFWPMLPDGSKRDTNLGTRRS